MFMYFIFNNSSIVLNQYLHILLRYKRFWIKEFFKFYIDTAMKTQYFDVYVFTMFNLPFIRGS